MEESFSREQAQAELEKIRMLIQFVLGQNQALETALGAALSALPEASPVRAAVMSALETRRRLIQTDQRTLGVLDGFDAFRIALSTAMGEDSPASPQTGPSGGH